MWNTVRKEGVVDNRDLDKKKPPISQGLLSGFFHVVYLEVLEFSFSG